MAEYYRIVRYYRSERYPSETIAHGLTLEDARAHCADPESSSRTATSAEAVDRTKTLGDWFDGYEEQDR